MKVAVLGTGVMGRAMAANIARAGLDTTVWNRRRESAEPLAAEAPTVADSPADAVRDAEVVITMLTNADAVLAVAGQMLSALRAGAVWAQMSTIGVDGTEQAARLVAGQRPDVTLVDALVSGWAALKLDRIAADDYSDEYSLALATKDVELAVSHATLPVAPHILELWRRCVAAGLGDLDLTVVTRELRS